MLRHSQNFHRAAAPRNLRSHLRRLRSVCRSAREELRRRRTESMKAPPGAATGLSSSTDTGTGAHTEILPRNDALESALALAISENRDARTELEFTRHFLGSTLLSLAAPVGPWDPYDTKPQVFALDTYMALPVFTSLECLRLFCQRFRFTVRDPSGALWADGPADDDSDRPATLPVLPNVTGSVWWERHVRRHAQTPALEPRSGQRNEPEALGPLAEKEKDKEKEGSVAPWMNADALFDEVSTQEMQEVSTGEKAKRRKKKKRRVSRKAAFENEPNMESKRDTAAHNAFWAKVRATAPFGITRATPLHAFGPPLQPFFVGYFADVQTLLHNASIVPEKVDIVLNPCSPIEFVLAREATDRVLHGDQLLELAYRRVERELRGEFHRFFHRFCPEVRFARSACVSLPDPRAPGAVRHEIAVLLQSEDLSRTFACLQAAKRECVLMGHTDLDVLPFELAAPHVQEASTLFYERTAETPRRAAAQLGAFEQWGPVQTINIARPAESYYHDPSAAYTESHAVYTEELKVRRRVK